MGLSASSATDERNAELGWPGHGFVSDTYERFKAPRSLTVSLGFERYLAFLLGNAISFVAKLREACGTVTVIIGRVVLACRCGGLWRGE